MSNRVERLIGGGEYIAREIVLVVKEGVVKVNGVLYIEQPNENGRGFSFVDNLSFDLDLKSVVSFARSSRGIILGDFRIKTYGMVSTEDAHIYCEKMSGVFDV